MKPDQDAKIDFLAPAILKKWPSVNKERVSAALGARPYMIIEGSLDDCIRNFMLQPKSQHHLYEIHTAPQSDLVSITDPQSSRSPCSPRYSGIDEARSFARILLVLLVAV